MRNGFSVTAAVSYTPIMNCHRATLYTEIANRDFNASLYLGQTCPFRNILLIRANSMLNCILCLLLQGSKSIRELWVSGKFIMIQVSITHKISSYGRW